MPMTKNQQFYTKELGKLHGGKIIGCVVQEPAGNSKTAYVGDEFFGLLIEMPNGKKKELWLWRDDEGNGPGSFHIYDHTE